MTQLSPEIISFYSVVSVALIGAVASVIVAIVNKAKNSEPAPKIPRGTQIESTVQEATDEAIDFLKHLRARNAVLLEQNARQQKIIEEKDRKITKLLVLLAKHGIDPPF